MGSLARLDEFLFLRMDFDFEFDIFFEKVLVIFCCNLDGFYPLCSSSPSDLPGSGLLEGSYICATLALMFFSI